MKNNKPFEIIIRKKLVQIPAGGPGLFLTSLETRNHSDNGNALESKSVNMEFWGGFEQGGLLAVKVIRRSLTKNEADNLSQSLYSLHAHVSDNFDGMRVGEEVRQSVIPGWVFGIQKKEANLAVDFVEITAPIGDARVPFDKEGALKAAAEALRSFLYT